MLTKALTFGIRFFLTPFILHRLGDTQFGLWALVGSVVGQGELLDLGIRAALTKYVAEHYSRGNHEYLRHLIATSLWLYCGLGLLAFALAALLAPLFPHLFNVPLSQQATATAVVLLMGVQIGIALPGAAPAAVLWGMHRYGLVNALIVTSTVVSAAITFVVLLAGGDLIAMLAATIPLPFVMLILGMYLLRRIAPELWPHWLDARRELFRSVLSFSGATFIIETAFSLQTKTDEVVIGAALPISAVSPYSIARRLSGVPQMVAQQTVGSLLPIAAELHAEGAAERLRALYLSASRITLAICIPLSAVLIALAAPLLALWVGPEYSRYSPIVVILALAGLAEISHWPGGLILQGIARHRLLALAYICAAFANLGISILLVRSYGLIGVALGTLIPSTALSVCFVWPYAARVLDVPTRDLLQQVFLPAFWPLIPMLIVIYGAGRVVELSGFIPTVIAGGMALATYAGLYLVLSASDTERQLIRSALTNLKSAASFGPRGV